MRSEYRLSRRSFARSVALGVPLAGLAVAREGAEVTAAGTNPAKDWARAAKAEDEAFSSTGLQAVERSLYALATTSLMIVRSGRIVYTYGDVAHVSYLASARKSVLSMLYGKYVANGTIDLDRTIGDVGIDENGGLMPIEKRAKIRHLLMASSGVYYPAGSPGGSESTPARGSKEPGSYFLYNNWDFNVAGAIFEKLTGQTVFQALSRDLAEPLQFQDFDPARQRMLGYESPNTSRYKAYHLFLSARDMARLGVLMVNGGKWNGRQIVPAGWVKESTTQRVKAADMAARSESGYAYLWWLPSDSRTGPAFAGSYMANGNYGQYLLCLPAIDTVIVHRRAVTDEFAIARNLGRTNASPAGGNVDFLKIADAIVAAHV
jgi:CubicO group peptidase (beta-lactamase class C family)